MFIPLSAAPRELLFSGLRNLQKISSKKIRRYFCALAEFQGWTLQVWLDSDPPQGFPRGPGVFIHRVPPPNLCPEPRFFHAY